MSDKFQEAAVQVKKLKSLPDNGELLELYAFFKQATVGDNDQPKPGMFQLKEKSKHETWMKKKGMGREDAENAYIELVDTLIEKYGLQSE